MSTHQQEGTVLDGKYEVLEHLGGGGMGEVHLVRHVHLEEKRVVKILRADRVSDPDAQKRFLREARFATQIKHPHVAILYDYSRLEDGSFYMVWEYIEGEDVGTKVRRDGPFPLKTGIELGIQALEGLKAIHAAGMIHRDVSPDNLMIATTAQQGLHLKIIDLGLAKNLEPDPDLEVTQDGMFMGKLLYCAPEQAGLHKGETLDARSDLYSFALVLYEMLTGLPPFEAETPQGAVFKRLSEDPIPMVDRNPRSPVPAELERVVLKALERERGDRYPDAATFIQALQRVGRRLDRASTQEVPRPSAVELEETGGGSRELSREEKEDLLARIEQAARRVREGSKTLGRVEALLSGGQMHEARELVDRLERDDPKARSLPALKELLAAADARAVETRDDRKETMEDQRRSEARAALDRARAAADGGRLDEARAALKRARELVPEAPRSGTPTPEQAVLEDVEGRVSALERAAERRARIDEAAAMVQRYVKNKQLSLARLALDTLIELAPTHPKRTDFESWVDLLADEVEHEKRADELVAEGREAIERGDLRAARRQLAPLRKADEDRAEAFERELEAAEREAEQTADMEDHRERMETFLRERRLAEAQKELDTLAKLGAAKVTVDLYRARLDELRTSARDQAQLDVFLEAFRERLDAGDHAGARAVAGELQRAMPDDPRPSELLAEVARLEGEADRRRALEDGEHQVERYIEAGDAAKAELALRVLLQMAPGHKKRKGFERRIAKLQK